MKCRIGAATSDCVMVNQHFGRARKFLIIDVGDDNEIKIVEERNINPVCDGGIHNDNKLKENADKLSDCNYILVSRIGQGALNVLESRGIQVYEIPDFIEEAINKLLAYIEIQNMLNY